MDIDNLKLELSKKEELINNLNKELDEQKIINKSTKDYIFILETDLKNKNKKIKKLKKNNRKLKKKLDKIASSKIWKITKPFRQFKKLF